MLDGETLRSFDIVHMCMVYAWGKWGRLSKLLGRVVIEERRVLVNK